ncbi:TPA: hypothetical protein LVM22_001077 [Klebsiella oxytoca]|nr:hypothetical protein [Klebsiella oxytoca]
MYYFVSDNSYFLNGLEKSRTDWNSNISVILYSDVYPVFNPAPNDVVIIAIVDARKRYRISGMEQLAHCRVIILLTCATFARGSPGDPFPWILSWRINTDMLNDYIVMALSAPFCRRYIAKQDWLIFYYLSRGDSVTQLASRMNSSEKFISLLKRRRILGYGLKGNGATASLAFRDIGRLSVVN